MPPVATANHPAQRRPRHRAVGFNEPKHGVERGRTSQQPESGVRDLAGWLDEDPRIVSGGIQVKPTHHFVGNVLEITMHQRQQTKACQED